MKEKLFLGAALLLGSFYALHAQEACNTATFLNTGTTTVPAITGTYNDVCWNSGNTNALGEPMKGMWYRFIPQMDGTLTITANLPQNTGPNYSDDTRLSVYTGFCNSLTCAYFVDDDEDPSILHPTLQFEVVADEWYTILWDNWLDAKGFDFSVTFVPNPIEPAPLPYQFGFETSPLNEGWSKLSLGSDWGFLPDDNAHPSHQGDGLAGIFGSNQPIDSWLFSRGIELEGGETVNVGYYVRQIPTAGTGGPHPLQVTVGNAATIPAQTTVLGTLANVTNTTYQSQSHTFTAPADGVYYIGFHDTAPAHSPSNAGMLLLDTFSVTAGTAGTNDNELSGLKIFPNPAVDLVTVAAQNVLISNIQITDINGRTVKAYDIAEAEEATVSINGLSAGIYMVKVSSDKGVITKKIVKN